MVLRLLVSMNLNPLPKPPLKKSLYLIFGLLGVLHASRKMPGFEKVNAQDPKLELMFISLDDGNKIQRVREFIQKKEIKAPVFLLDDRDDNKWIYRVSSDWSGAIPATLFISPDGKRFFTRDFSMKSN